MAFRRCVPPQANTNTAGRAAAFTIIELLVVIAIIAILVGLLFPAFGTVKEQGRISVCTNHLQQLHRAMAAYAQDHQGRFPSNEGGSNAALPSWVNAIGPTGSNGVLSITQGLLWPYINDLRVYRCPSYTDEAAVRSYSMLEYLSGRRIGKVNGTSIAWKGVTRNRAETFAEVESPSQSPMIAEENAPGYPPRDGRVFYNDGYLQRSRGDRFGSFHRADPNNAFAGKVNVVFVDGHVQLMSTREVDVAYDLYYGIVPPP